MQSFFHMKKIWQQSSFLTGHPENAQFFIDEVEKSGISNRTVNATRQAVGMVFRSLSAAGKISIQNPFAAVGKLADETKSREALSLEQARNLLALFDDPSFEIRGKEELHVAVLLGLSCGMRLVDACRLKWESVDLERRIIQFVPIKTKRTGKTVTVYINGALLEVFESRKRDGVYVLPSLAEAHQRDSTRICRNVERLFEAIGLKNPEKAEGRRVKKGHGSKQGSSFLMIFGIYKLFNCL